METIAYVALGSLILYIVLATAVKTGIKEALNELKKEGFFRDVDH